MAALGIDDVGRAAIGAAVAAAEAGTDGEILIVAARRSDPYHDVALHYAIAAMLAVVAVNAAFPALFGLGERGWGEPDLGRGLFVLLLAQIVAFLAVRFALAWAPLRLWLTPPATRARRVRRRAIEAFKVGAERRTAGREAVLLYLSLDEHAAEIVADAAVHRLVAAERWGAAMAALVDEVRAGRPAEGLVAATSAIGTILAEHLPKTAENPNEIPDALIEL